MSSGEIMLRDRVADRPQPVPSRPAAVGHGFLRPCRPPASSDDEDLQP
jgi:hypothetical protein